MDKQIGIIGVGNMGKMLIQTFITQNRLNASQIWITNRSSNKAIAIQNIYPQVHWVQTVEEIGKHCDLIFLCAKPIQIIQIAKKIAPILNKNQIVISITSSISVTDLEAIVPAQTARIVPSILNQTQKGNSLFTFGNRCSTETKAELKKLFEQISISLEVTDNKIRAASDLVSCGPAFIGRILEWMCEGAQQATPLSKEEAEKMITETIIGLGALLEKGDFTLPKLIEKVCVKGGITGEGLAVIDREIGQLFPHLFYVTEKKFQLDKTEIKNLLTYK